MSEQKVRINHNIDFGFILFVLIFGGLSICAGCAFGYGIGYSIHPIIAPIGAIIGILVMAVMFAIVAIGGIVITIEKY